MPDVPPPLLSTPRSQLGRLRTAGFVSQQQADWTADLLVTIARLQSEVLTLKLTSPAPPEPATWTQPTRRRSVVFTNTEVPQFRGVTSWDQYRQLFDAIVGSNGWDEYSRPTAECLPLGAGGTKSHANQVGQCTE